jgi:hypothetical protein
MELVNWCPGLLRCWLIDQLERLLPGVIAYGEKRRSCLPFDDVLPKSFQIGHFEVIQDMHHDVGPA